MIGHGDIQAEISARLDGESGTIPDDVLAAHLDSCEQCGEFFSRAVRLQDELGPSDAPAEEAPAPEPAPSEPFRGTGNAEPGASEPDTKGQDARPGP